MDKEEYRRQYEAQLKKADEEQAFLENALHLEKPVHLELLDPSDKLVTKALIEKLPYVREQRSVDLLTALINNQNTDSGTRSAALQTLTIQVSESREMIDWVLSILRDTNQPLEVRITSLIVLQQISFSSELLKPTDPEYVAILRSIIAEKASDLRSKVTEILALNNDKFIQDKLVAGLKEKSQSLVPPQKAIQLLGNDIHGGYFPLLREIVENPPNVQSKIEAIKVLAADKNSIDIILKTLNNTDEKKEVRNISAIAYQSIDPLGFSEYAKKTILNEAVNNELRKVFMTALSQQIAAGNVQRDLKFESDLKDLQFKTASKNIVKLIGGLINLFNSSNRLTR